MRVNFYQLTSADNPGERNVSLQQKRCNLNAKIDEILS